ncbi:MAG: M15 family metallopeptidase [Cellvibrionaceae bacterium]
MKRRELLAGVAVGTAFAAGNAYLWNMAEETAPDVYGDDALAEAGSYLDRVPDEAIVDREAPVSLVGSDDSGPVDDSAVKASVSESSIEEKVRNFENNFSDDIYLLDDEFPLLESVTLRLERVQRVVGHGHFNVLDFDQLLQYAKGYNSVGAFTPEELAFIEKIYFTQASDYGFLGVKVTDNLTTKITRSEIVKVPYSGHFLFKGESLNYYEKLKQDIGPNVILTSGIRSNVKQLHLFLSKARASGYNLSKASRSLAPPGHSYHGIGDFDVGRVGWGALNFTNQFASTDEFKRMQDLGYVQIRYTEDNRLGVRFEPWHIKVV